MSRGAVLFALIATQAWAVEIPTGGTPARVNVTNTTVAAWHGDNGNRSSCDDLFAEGLERLNVTGGWGDFGAGLRLDGALYYPTPEPTLSGPGGNPCLEVELQKRYLTTGFLEKIWVGWTGRNLEVTLGDSYVQFGRGLSLSLRKTDELGTDTTQRGLRLRLNTDRVTATLVGGITNINNVDESSGKWDVDPEDGVLGLSADARVWETLRVGGSATGFLFHEPMNTFTPPGVDNSFQERWLVGGPRIEAARLTDWLGVYLEGVAQRRMFADGEVETGYGLYGSLTGYFGPATVLLEVKAYGDLAVVQPAWDSLEFQPVQYTSLPTLERVQQVIENPQREIYGGRARVDYSLRPGLGVFANLGLFNDVQGYLDPDTFVERPGTIYDPYVGVDARFGDYTLVGQTGVRWVRVGPHSVHTDGHLDLDVIRALKGWGALEVHVTHLERGKTVARVEDTWREGTLQVSYRNRPKYALTAILDYTTEAGQPAIWYPGVQGEWEFTRASNIKLFAGSSRGGLKCVSGVCRIFPPFTGVKATLSLRY